MPVVRESDLVPRHWVSVSSSLCGDELLAAVDVVRRARERGVDHDVNGERRDVGRPDDAADRELRPQLLAPGLELITDDVGDRSAFTRFVALAPYTQVAHGEGWRTALSFVTDHRPGALHRALGVQASTRASFYLYNTLDEVDALAEGIRQAQRFFQVA